MYQPIEFLLVEDNPGDVRLTQECFRDYKLSNAMSVVADGDHALAYLRREGEYARVSPPDIILCNLPLYRAHIGSVWDIVRQDQNLRDIPLVLLTSFEGEEDSLVDVSAIACCIAKPLDFGRITSIVQRVNDLGIVITAQRNRFARSSAHVTPA